MTGITPSSTVGPFFLFGLFPSTYGGSDFVGSDLTTPDTDGERISITGRVTDSDGVAVPDAMLEIWQADAAGRYAHPRDQSPLPNSRFTGFGRSATDAEGRFSFTTIRPGAVPAPDGGTQAPHIAVHVFARGMLKPTLTRIYFADATENAADTVLALVPAGRRDTLIARRAADGAYVFDVRLQGENETVFFAA